MRHKHGYPIPRIVRVLRVVLVVVTLATLVLAGLVAIETRPPRVAHVAPSPPLSSTPQAAIADAAVPARSPAQPPAQPSAQPFAQPHVVVGHTEHNTEVVFSELLGCADLYAGGGSYAEVVAQWDAWNQPADMVEGSFPCGLTWPVSEVFAYWTPPGEGY